MMRQRKGQRFNPVSRQQSGNFLFFPQIRNTSPWMEDGSCFYCPVTTVCPVARWKRDRVRVSCETAVDGWGTLPCGSLWFAHAAVPAHTHAPHGRAGPHHRDTLICLPPGCQAGNHADAHCPGPDDWRQQAWRVPCHTAPATLTAPLRGRRSVSITMLFRSGREWFRVSQWRGCTGYQEELLQQGCGAGDLIQSRL